MCKLEGVAACRVVGSVVTRASDLVAQLQNVVVVEEFWKSSPERVKAPYTKLQHLWIDTQVVPDT